MKIKKKKINKINLTFYLMRKKIIFKQQTKKKIKPKKKLMTLKNKNIKNQMKI